MRHHAKDLRGEMLDAMNGLPNGTPMASFTLNCVHGARDA
jgi:hypothetical protein